MEEKTAMHSRTIKDFESKYRDILEEGINLLRYGFSDNQIREFMVAVRKDPELADFITEKMNIWGPGLEYEP